MVKEINSHNNSQRDDSSLNKKTSQIVEFDVESNRKINNHEILTTLDFEQLNSILLPHHPDIDTG